MTTPAWHEVTQRIHAAHRILIVTHVFPDGDALGSLLGLGLALRAQGKQVDLAVDDDIPKYLEFLPHVAEIQLALAQGDWDLLISLDASDEARIGKVGAYGRAHTTYTLVIDHHPTNTLFGDLNIVQADAVSTTEMVQDWLALTQQPLTLEIATALLTGLVTDTMGFRTSNVNAKTLQLAQALMSAGAPLSAIVARTLNSKPYRAIKLWQRVLASVQLEAGLISGVVTIEDWKAAGFEDSTDGGLVSFLVTTDEVKVAVVYKEDTDNKVEISLRSTKPYDVGAVALSLGGGGHKQASGATIEGPLDAAQARVTSLLRAAIVAGDALPVE
jgi:bifunctional oligoribonuclease and PAP phosphatase NrnA